MNVAEIISKDLSKDAYHGDARQKTNVNKITIINMYEISEITNVFWH